MSFNRSEDILLRCYEVLWSIVVKFVEKNPLQSHYMGIRIRHIHLVFEIPVNYFEHGIIADSVQLVITHLVKSHLLFFSEISDCSELDTTTHSLIYVS